jgi:nucleoside-diphosphate-sugar epimerase
LGGYILRELLGAGHTVTDYDRVAPREGGVEFIQGDIFEVEKLVEACRGRDAVIHMAGVPGPGRASPANLINVNLVGTVNVLEAARGAGIRKFVLASSGAATGFTFQKHTIVPRYLPIDEEHPAEPQDEYGLSKLLAELACKRYSDAFGMQTVCLRINHNWYVDRAGAEVAVGTGWARQLASVEELWSKRYLKTLEEPEGEWPVPGPPRPSNLLWAVTDARDAAQAFRLAAETGTVQHGVFLINGDDTCSLEETPVLISRYFANVPLKVPLQGYASLVSHDKATRILGYRPQYTWRKSDFRDWMDARKREDVPLKA